MARSLAARRLGALLALFAFLWLGLHELHHAVAAETPDDCPFAFVAGGLPPPVVVADLVRPDNVVVERVALAAQRFVAVAPSYAHSARGPPLSSRV